MLFYSYQFFDKCNETVGTNSEVLDKNSIVIVCKTCCI